MKENRHFPANPHKTGPKTVTVRIKDGISTALNIYF